MAEIIGRNAKMEEHGLPDHEPGIPANAETRSSIARYLPTFAGMTAMVRCVIASRQDKIFQADVTNVSARDIAL